MIILFFPSHLNFFPFYYSQLPLKITVKSAMALAYQYSTRYPHLVPPVTKGNTGIYPIFFLLLFFYSIPCLAIRNIRVRAIFGSWQYWGHSNIRVVAILGSWQYWGHSNIRVTAIQRVLKTAPSLLIPYPPAPSLLIPLSTRPFPPHPPSLLIPFARWSCSSRCHGMPPRSCHSRHILLILLILILVLVFPSRGTGRVRDKQVRDISYFIVPFSYITCKKV